MRRLALTAAALALLATPAVAQDKLATGWYGTLSAGALMPRDKDGNEAGIAYSFEFDRGWTIAGAAGYRFANGFRAEGELSYGRTGLDSVSGGGATANLDGDVDVWSLTGAAYYDIATGTAFTPYFGAGAGVVRQKLDSISVTLGGNTVTADGDSATDLTAFAEAGVSIGLGNKFDLVPSYRYQWVNDGGNGEDDTTAHILRVGLRYWFN